MLIRDHVKATSHLMDITTLTSPHQLWTGLTDAIDEALSQNSQIVTFPEYIWAGLAMYFKDEYEYFKVTSAYIWQILLPHLVARYQSSQALIQLGTAPYLSESSRLINRAITITPNGLLCQDKLFLTPWERSQGFEGSYQVNIGSFKGYRFCVLICFDSEIPDISAQLRAFDLDFIMVPAATETRHGCHRVHRGASARAMELGSAVLVAQLTGTSPHIDLVNENLGCSGLYLPLQSPINLDDTAQRSGQTARGSFAHYYTLPLSAISASRKRPDETNPSLVQSKSNIAIVNAH